MLHITIELTGAVIPSNTKLLLYIVIPTCTEGEKAITSLCNLAKFIKNQMKA